MPLVLPSTQPLRKNLGCSAGRYHNLHGDFYSTGGCRLTCSCWHHHCVCLNYQHGIDVGLLPSLLLLAMRAGVVVLISLVRRSPLRQTGISMRQELKVEPGSIIELPPHTQHRVGIDWQQGPMNSTIYFGVGTLEEVGISFNETLKESVAANEGSVLQA